MMTMTDLSAATDACRYLGNLISEEVDLHEEDCPEDDTCECELNTRVNAAFAAIQAAIDAASAVGVRPTGAELYNNMWNS